MKPKDLLDSVDLVLAKTVRPLLTVGLWAALIAYFGGFSLSGKDIQMLRDVAIETQIRILPSVGLRLELWQLGLAALLLAAFLFDRLLALLWPFFPWQMSWSTADFWRAHKSIAVPARAAEVLKLGAKLGLSDIESQLKLALSTLEKNHPGLVAQRFGATTKQLATFSRYYTALGVSLMLGLAAILATLVFSSLGPLSRPTLLASLTVLLLLLVVRTGCEFTCERVERDRQMFVLEHLDLEQGQNPLIPNTPPETYIRIAELVAQQPKPGLPFGRVWILHWLRQMPMLSSIGSYPWRTIDDALREHSELHHLLNGRLKTTRSALQPDGRVQRIYARTLRWLCRRRLIRNGSALTGGEIRWDEVRV